MCLSRKHERNFRKWQKHRNITHMKMSWTYEPMSVFVKRNRIGSNQEKEINYFLSFSPFVSRGRNEGKFHEWIQMRRSNSLSTHRTDRTFSSVCHVKLISWGYEGEEEHETLQQGQERFSPLEEFDISAPLPLSRERWYWLKVEVEERSTRNPHEDRKPYKCQTWCTRYTIASLRQHDTPVKENLPNELEWIDKDRCVLQEMHNLFHRKWDVH